MFTHSPGLVPRTMIKFSCIPTCLGHSTAPWVLLGRISWQLKFCLSYPDPPGCFCFSYFVICISFEYVHALFAVSYLAGRCFLLLDCFSVIPFLYSLIPFGLACLSYASHLPRVSMNLLFTIRSTRHPAGLRRFLCSLTFCFVSFCSSSASLLQCCCLPGVLLFCSLVAVPCVPPS